MYHTRSEQTLEAGLQDLKASSGTFYVRDPWWPNQFRLVCLPGVKNTEPMHGFLPASSFRKLTATDRQTYSFFSDAQQDPELSAPVSPLLAPLIEQNKLFGSFVQREGVFSSARLRHFDDAGELQAVLWINYDKKKKNVSNKHKLRMQELLSQMTAYLADIQKQLRRKILFPPQLAHILQLAENLKVNSPDSEKEYLTNILKTILETLQINQDNGFGNIYLFNPQRQTLEMKLIEPDCNPPIKEIAISKGEGIVSWVALKRQALLITDLENSAFKQLYRSNSSLPVFAQELAVPMIANDQLIGVINVECKGPSPAFEPEAVRAIWYGANQAAIACYLAQQVRSAEEQKERARTLLKITHQVPSQTGSESLGKLAELTRKWLKAFICDIWPYDKDEKAFSEVGTSRQISHRPRPDGWSYYMRRDLRPIWVSDIKAPDKFQAKYWDDKKQQWSRFKATDGCPATINENLNPDHVQCELGLPIVANGSCAGVVWIKYAVSHPEPQAEEMEDAIWLADEFSLVMDVLKHNKEAAELNKILNKIWQKFIPTREIKFPGIEGYVINHAYGGGIGGDFYGIAEIDGHQTSFLIGDAEFHGLHASLSMLPMMTTFRLIAKDTPSPKHVIWKLRSIYQELGLPGSAISFVIDVLNPKKPYLFASRASHPALIIVRDEGRSSFEFPSEEANTLGFGVDPILATSPLCEEVWLLEPGDLVIAYTDGITEAGAKADRMFGFIPLKQLVEKYAAQPPEIIAHAVEQAVLEHVEDNLDDDVTIMVLRVGTPGR